MGETRERYIAGLAAMGQTTDGHEVYLCHLQHLESDPGVRTCSYCIGYITAVLVFTARAKGSGSTDEGARARRILEQMDHD